MTGNVVVSRKRKAWEGVHTGGNKYVGSGRLPPARGLDDEEGTNGLETPNCSNTGFEDEVGSSMIQYPIPTLPLLSYDD